MTAVHASTRSQTSIDWTKREIINKTDQLTTERFDASWGGSAYNASNFVVRALAVTLYAAAVLGTVGLVYLIDGPSTVTKKDAILALEADAKAVKLYHPLKGLVFARRALKVVTTTANKGLAHIKGATPVRQGIYGAIALSGIAAAVYYRDGIASGVSAGWNTTTDYAQAGFEKLPLLGGFFSKNATVVNATA